MPTLRTNAPGATDQSGMPQQAVSINAPQIEEARTLRATTRAISSIDQIYSICEAGFNPDSDRNIKNGVIAAQMNDAPPFGTMAIKGQNYRHNFSTGFLSGIMDAAISGPVDMLDQAQYLTSASLDTDDDPSGELTDLYRREFTKMIRGWDGWNSHKYNLACETLVYGYCAVVADDPDDWRPYDCRQDNFGVPDNTGQTASKCQFFFIKKSFFIDELITKLLQQPAEANGPWDREACVGALNSAMPQDRQGDALNTSTRSFVDLVRDGNSGAAYDPKSRTVDCYILWAKEADGKVSKFIVTQRTPNLTGADSTATAEGQNRGRLLYEFFDEFEKLEDAIMFYSLKPGTGTLYSSKGGGRDLINVALSQERSRCKACDHTWLSGIVWMHSPKGMVAVQLKVGDTSAIIGSEAQVVSDALPDRSEIFDRQDERLTRWAQQKFGIYMPEKPSQTQPAQGSKRTAREVTVDYQREQMMKASWLKRFFGQFGDEMTIVAKKAGNPDTTDKVAKEWQEKLEEGGITADLLEKLVNQPQGMLIEDMSQKRTQALIGSLKELQASPFWDQYKVQRELGMRIFGKELTERLMFPNGIDPTSQIANVNQQIIESEAIRTGGSPPPVPTQHHKTHLDVLIGQLNDAEPEIAAKVKDGRIMQQPQILDNHQTAIKHGDAHIGYWEKDAKIRRAGPELQEIQKYKGRLKQSQDLQDAALKELKAKKQQMDEQQQSAAEMANRLIGPNGQKGGQQQGGMDEDILKALINHIKDLKPPIAKQVLDRCGLDTSMLGQGESAFNPPETPPIPLNGSRLAPSQDQGQDQDQDQPQGQSQENDVLTAPA